MIQPVKHHAVNWVDGMKISQKHFTAQEDYFLDAVRDTASYPINELNYGLLPVKTNGGDFNSFDIYNSATNDVQLVIRQCHAVTPAGYRIAVTDLTLNVTSLPSFTLAGNDGEGQFYILISVNPFDRIPSGEFDPEETPPRHIITLPKYHVEVVPVSTVSYERSGGNYIVAGKILFNNGIVQADESFVPPCTCVHSHPVLLKQYNHFAKMIAGLQQFALRIIQKSNYKNQNSVLAEGIKKLSEVMLTQFAQQYFYYRNTVHQLPPVYMINVFARLAHSLYNAIEMLSLKDKEEILNYCYEWSDVAPHTLLTQLSAVIEINYNHYNNGVYVETISRMLHSLHDIWNKLSSLEYVGQHKENIIVKEEAVTKVIRENKGWSVLD